MDLSAKGSSATVAPGFNSLIATMKWNASADFDLGAIGVRPDGSHNMVYYKNLGDFGTDGMQLSGDAGVGDTGGSNEEQLTMVDLSQYDKVYIVVSDYGAIAGGGQMARFDQGVTLDVQDDRGTSHHVELNTATKGNAALVATISKAGPFFSLKNNSEVASFSAPPQSTHQILRAFGL